MKRIRVVLPLLGLALAQLHFGLAADASYYGVIKSTQYEQTVSAPPVVLASNAYAFNAFVWPATNFVVTNATVKPPNATPARTLTLDTNGAYLRFSEFFDTPSALDGAYPSSASLFNPSVYVFTIHAVNDGARSGKASYLLSSTPSTPQLTGLAAAQSLDTTRDFTVTWNSLGGSSLDLVQLLVLDAESNVVYTSAFPFTTNALNGASTSETIPANALPPGASLTGHLLIAKPGLPDTSTYPGATGIAALAKDTAFPMTTRPAPVRPRLEIASTAAPVQIHFTGETNRNYHLQAATNFLNWADLLVTNRASVSFTDTQSTSLPRRFYRIQVGP